MLTFDRIKDLPNGTLILVFGDREEYILPSKTGSNRISESRINEDIESLDAEAKLYKQKIKDVRKLTRELKWYKLSGKLNKLRESLRRQVNDLRTY